MTDGESDRTQAMTQFVTEYLDGKAEIYSQKLNLVGLGAKENLYAYIRSKDGPGGECNVISAPLESKPTITYLLTFLKMMQTRQPDWQSKDLLFLFYPDGEYSLAVKEFLDTYYDVDQNNDPNVQSSGARPSSKG